MNYKMNFFIDFVDESCSANESRKLKAHTKASRQAELKRFDSHSFLFDVSLILLRRNLGLIFEIQFGKLSYSIMTIIPQK